MKALNQVFSPHGFVEKIVTFQKSAGFQALIQYQGRQNAILARISLQGHNIYDDCYQLDIQFSNLDSLQVHCNNERRDFTNPNLPTEQKGEPSQHLGYGYAGVGFPQMANATAIATAFGRVPIDAEEYRTILKNKIHQACAIVALSYASIVKAAGSFAQAENQVLQSGSDVQGSSKTQEQGEPDAGISAVSTTQKMSGTQVRQAVSGINDRCTMMGKVSPNEYPLSGVPVANDPIDDFDGF
ncbi:hypothetical protein J1N35_025846 [Gossypium stocksii]|uniref:PTBP1-like RNA recognition motif 2 domain-containing protein n=1 Tax=Gossypium stocksii TaxID=47602 RepID=A0A9D3ZYN4_9ROSI|nr:hypothetical protein J1N35_025846 [Gossypium stocksii]